MRLLGEAWYHSPIVLSWPDVLKAGRDEAGGHNLVLHEFAHYLDGLDGSIDGTPPLDNRDQETAWHQVTEAEYRRLVGQAKRHEDTLLDQYGAMNRAEVLCRGYRVFFRASPGPPPRAQGPLRVVKRLLPAGPGPVAARRPRRFPGRPPGAGPAGGPPPPLARELGRVAQRRRALFTLAVEAFRREDYALAEKAVSRAIDLEPDDVEAYQQRAAARVKLGRFAAALADCQTALDLVDRDPDTYRIRAEAYLGLRQYGPAKDDLDRALRRKSA